MTKLSVIIPINNICNNIDKCLDSLLNQKFDDYEIIIINGNSEMDDTLNNYKSDKINIINKKANDMSVLLNTGIDASSGEYLTFVNIDDYVSENMLDSFYTYACKYDLDLVTGSYNEVIKNKINACVEPKYKIGNIKTTPQILYLTKYDLVAKAFRRNILIDNNIRFMENNNFSQLHFICKMLLHSKLVGYLKEPYYYKVCSKKENIIFDEKIYDIFDVLKAIKDDYKKEFSLRNEIDFLLINEITNYMSEACPQKTRKIKKNFTSAGYEFLDKNVKEWKNNKYYKETKKRLNNKKVLKGHGFWYGIFK